MKQDSTKLILIGVFVIFLLASLVVELPVSMNYLQARSFWQSSIITGIILGASIGGLLLWQQWHQITELVARMQLFFAVFISICIITPLLLSWCNRLGVPASSSIPTSVVVESQQARFSSRFGSSRLQKSKANQYLLFFYRDGQLYRIQDDQPFFEKVETGDTLTLNITEGRLGYEWVETQE